MWGKWLLDDAEKRLLRALRELRKQHHIALQIDDLGNREARLKLLSHSLRTFCWLDAQRRVLRRQIDP